MVSAMIGPLTCSCHRCKKAGGGLTNAFSMCWMFLIVTILLVDVATFLGVHASNKLGLSR